MDFMEAHGYHCWFAWDFLVHDYEHSVTSAGMAVGESGETHTLRIDPALIRLPEIQAALGAIGAKSLNQPHTLFRASGAGCH